MPTFRTVRAAALRRDGYEVVETVDGAAAWQMLQQSDATLPGILDRMMPQTDGLEAAASARSA